MTKVCYAESGDEALKGLFLWIAGVECLKADQVTSLQVTKCLTGNPSISDEVCIVKQFCAR